MSLADPGTRSRFRRTFGAGHFWRSFAVAFGVLAFRQFVARSSWLLAGLELANKDGSLYFLRAGIFLQLKQIPAALTNLDEAIAHGGDHAASRRKRGVQLFQLRRFQEAATDLSKAIDYEKGENPVNWHLCGHAQAMDGRWGEAVENFEQAARRDPTNWQYQYDQAVAAMKAASDRHYQQAVARSLASLNLRGLPHLISFHTATLRPSSIVELVRYLPHIERLARSGKDVNAQQILGAVLCRIGLYQEAEPALMRALRLRGSAKSPHVHLFLAMVQHNLAKPDEAKTSLATARQIVDQLRNALTPWQTRVELEALLAEIERMLDESETDAAGRRSQVQELWETELARLDRAIAAAPQDLRSRGRRGALLARTKQWKRAAEYRRQIIQSEADNQQCLVLTGSGEYVIAPHVPFDKFASFTIEAWVKSFNGRLVIQGKDGDPESSVWLILAARDRMTHGGWEKNGGDYDLQLVDEQEGWKHVALVFDGAKQLLFVNGRLAGERPAPKPGPFEPPRPLMIGEIRSAPKFASGFVRGVRISKSARYTGDFTPPEQLTSDDMTVLLFDFSEVSADEVRDLSGNGNDGKIHNAWWLQHKLKAGQ